MISLSLYIIGSIKNEGPLPKMLNSPADGTNVSLPLGCKSLVQPLVEDLFTNYANGPGNPPAPEPSVGLFNIFLSGPSFCLSAMNSSLFF